MNASAIHGADVAILLGTYNGEAYLRDQLRSYELQTHREWAVFASDDGSSDSTVDILSAYAETWGKDRLSIKLGPKQGFAANFMSLVRDSGIRANYYAYSDQDDIWNPDKLDLAVGWLRTIPAETPALYCSGATLIDGNNHEIGHSGRYKKSPSFPNSLVQNIAGGNTMVFNQAARDLLCLPPGDHRISYHDWWTYIVVAACGGKVNFDPRPSVRYRQHGSNLVGEKTGVVRFNRGVGNLLDGKFRDCVRENIVLLEYLGRHLSESSRITLGYFVRARQSSLLSRLILFRRSGVYRQKFIDRVGLLVAEILGVV